MELQAPAAGASGHTSVACAGATKDRHTMMRLDVEPAQAVCLPAVGLKQPAHAQYCWLLEQPARLSAGLHTACMLSPA